MKKLLALLMIVTLSICLFPACSNTEEDVDANDVTVEEEMEDAEIAQFEDEDESIELKTKTVDDSFFYGTWEAETDRASYMYGNVTITINEDGTWDGNITEEEVTGTWEHKGEGIRLTSELIPFNMVYSSNNNVILQETDDAVRVVLTRK